MDGTVLLADDDRTIRTVLVQAFTRAGCKVHATSSLTTLMRWVAEGRGDVVISDVVMPDGNGLEMLPKISADRPGLPVIVISAQNTIMTAIRANEAEAYDYLPKPFDLPELMKRTARALESSRAARGQAPKSEERPDDLPLIGRTPVMQEVYKLVARVIQAEMAVLITGESGTGKSLVARAIHDFSDRRALPFVVVTSAELQQNDGAAQVLARARSGTIVLEGLDDLSAEAQGQVLRMMDTPGEHPPRFLATSQNSAGREALRDDLYFRLSEAVISLPGLRDRVEDVPLLADHFLMGQGSHFSGFSPEAMKNLAAYGWPGNVRQLENTVRRLALSAQAGEISGSAVSAILGTEPHIGSPALQANGPVSAETIGQSVEQHLQRYFDMHGGLLPPPGLYARILREIELPLIEIALEATGGNQAKCADLLGINRNTLRKKITELDIRVTRRRKLM